MNRLPASLPVQADRRRYACLAAAVLAFTVGKAWAQPPTRTPDAQIMRDARLVATAGRVDLLAHGIEVDPALAALADGAITRMEDILGRAWDAATFGERVRVYVSPLTRVSHVLGGYQHRSHPRAVLFLRPDAASRAITGADATYAHELAHLLTWRYHSHTLREGLADYLALQLHPGAGVGPNRDGHAGGDPPARIRDMLGTTAPPPAELMDDPSWRRSYYAASYRFVRYLVGLHGLPAFLDLYAAEMPEPLYLRLYGADRVTLVNAALR